MLRASEMDEGRKRSNTIKRRRMSGRKVGIEKRSESTQWNNEEEELVEEKQTAEQKGAERANEEEEEEEKENEKEDEEEEKEEEEKEEEEVEDGWPFILACSRNKMSCF